MKPTIIKSIGLSLIIDSHPILGGVILGLGSVLDSDHYKKNKEDKKHE